MRITILTLGSRGDVQPYVALGLGLRGVGHDVRVATHAEFEGFIRARGLEFSPLAGDPRSLLETANGQQLLASGGNPVPLIRQFVRLFEPLAHRCLADGWSACQDADAVVFSMAACFGHWIAQKRRVPSCAAYCLPLTPTCSIPSSVFPAWPAWLPTGAAAYNRLSYVLGGLMMWAPLQPAVNRARREVLDLPPVSRWEPPWRSLPSEHPYLYGFSPAVLPKPADWDERKEVTGYWFLDHSGEWKPPAKLVDFLRSGPAPVYVGFGSMNNRDADRATDLVVGALRRARQRGILVTGWGGLARTKLPDEILPIESVPHDWLFPRMAAVVHHGGAGTTAAGLRAGVPSVVVPFMSDQPMWARRVVELGAGPRPIPRKQLTSRRLAAAIQRAVADPRIRVSAAELGERLRAEDGVARAVEAFHRHLAVERPLSRPRPFVYRQSHRASRRKGIPALSQ